MDHADSQFTRDRIIASLKRNQTILDGILHGLTQTEATVATDGAGGWSVVQVVCHLRDLEEIYSTRIASMLAGDNPTFPRIDPNAIAAANDYAAQDLRAARAALLANRRATLATLDNLIPDAWWATGTHPVYGAQTVERLAFQIVTHDLDHLEQITRCLGRADRFA